MLTNFISFPFPGYFIKNPVIEKLYQTGTHLPEEFYNYKTMYFENITN